MASFSQRLNDLSAWPNFGIQELNQKSAGHAGTLWLPCKVSGRMEEDSQRSGDAIAEKMAKAVEEMERRQAEINEQTRSFVEGIRDMVSSPRLRPTPNLTRPLEPHATDGATIAAGQAQAEKSHQGPTTPANRALTDRTKGLVSDPVRRWRKSSTNGRPLRTYLGKRSSRHS